MKTPRSEVRGLFTLQKLYCPITTLLIPHEDILEGFCWQYLLMRAFRYLIKAEDNKFAIGAFNAANIETLKAVTQAAVKLQAPIIIEVSDGEVEFFGMHNLVSVIRTMEEELEIPIIINLDHGKDLDSCLKAIDAGFDYIHFDGSKLPFEENIKITKKIVEAAHAKEIPVEGEFNHIEGSSADHTSEDPTTLQNPELYTDPDEAYEFVNKTGIDVLAVFIGNLHGVYNTRMHLDLKRLKTLREAVPNIHMSLHGGSGIYDEDVKSAIQTGIVKVNVNSEMRIAFRMTLEEVLKESNEIAIYKLMDKPIQAVQKVVEYKIRLFGSVDQKIALV